MAGASDTTSSTVERRYVVRSLIGEGGFGKVYRAELTTTQGFRKDVAVKLLHKANVPEAMLGRFRDEARILGLVRDRAVVSVDPPTLLDGQWAVVMDYVDGASAQRLLKASGPMPPTVALEIVQEVARALDSVWRQPGPDGRPLELLHRDLKPGNLQITPNGEVRILDFGIARATFDEREAHTVDGVGGTVGYMAPERFDGVELPAGDVFSLGRVLHVFVTCDKPMVGGGYKPNESIKVEASVERDATISLAAQVAGFDASERPTMREVEELCRKLRASMQGPSLRDWAEIVVPRTSEVQADELVGRTLSDVMVQNLSERPTEAPPPSSFTRTVSSPTALVVGGAGLLGTSVLALAAAGIIAIVAVVGLGLGRAPSEPAVVEVPAVLALPPPSLPVAAGEPVVAIPPVAVVEAQPAEPPAVATPAVPSKVAVAAKVSAVEVAPVVAPPPVVEAVVAAPVEVQPTAPDPVSTFAITLGSIPAGAEVLIDGKSVGKTPLIGVIVSAGEHKVEMRSGNASIVRTIKAEYRGPARYMWKGGDTWQVLN